MPLPTGSWAPSYGPGGKYAFRGHGVPEKHLSLRASLPEFAKNTRDQDKDGLLESLQHNTYDIEFTGINPLSGVMYLAALRAIGKMADALCDKETSRRMKNKCDASSAALDKACFNGVYYTQAIDDVDALPYQFGTGCLSDQLFGQTLASLCGLGELLPKEHIQSAIKAVYQNNFLTGDKRPPLPAAALCIRQQAGAAPLYLAYGGQAAVSLCVFR